MDKLTVNQVKESLAPTFDKVQGFEETTADFGLTTHKEFISTLVAFSQDFEMESPRELPKDFGFQAKISIVGEKDKNCIHVFATRYCLPLHRVFRAYVRKNFRIDLNGKKLSEMLKNFPKCEFDFQIEYDNKTLLLKHNGIQYTSFSLLEAIDQNVVYAGNKLELGHTELSFFSQDYEQKENNLISVSNLEDLIKVAKSLGRDYIRIVSRPNGQDNKYVANIVSTVRKDFEETPVIALFRGLYTF